MPPDNHTGHLQHSQHLPPPLVTSGPEAYAVTTLTSLVAMQVKQPSPITLTAPGTDTAHGALRIACTCCTLDHRPCAAVLCQIGSLPHSSHHAHGHQTATSVPTTSVPTNLTKHSTQDHVISAPAEARHQHQDHHPPCHVCGRA